MRIAVRAIVVVFLALLVSVVLCATPTFTAAVTLAATAALIMGGSGLGDPTVITDLGLHVPIPNYITNVENYYIAPNSTCQPATCQLVPVVTPEGLLPPLIGNTTFDPSVAEGVTDLKIALQTQLANHPEDNVVVFGYSQSGDIITKTKRNFANDPTTAPPKTQVSFVVIGNTNRPNGGILARFPGLHIPVLNVTFDGAAPTDTGYPTTDIAFEYDPIADFPEYPINILADLNALVAFLDVHATYPNPYLPLPAGIPFFPTDLPGGYTPAELQLAINDPSNRQTYGDTTYITIPAINLPILQPLLDIGTDTGTSWLIKPIVDLIQPTLRVLIDLGYDRTIPFGQPTPAGLFPNIDPSTLAADLTAAVGQGIHDALGDLGVTSISPLAPSTSPNPSTLANTQVADSPTAVPQNTKPLRQSQSPTSTPSDVVAGTAATTPEADPGINRADNQRATALLETNRNSAEPTHHGAGGSNATTGTVRSSTSTALQTTPSSPAPPVATKIEKPTSSSGGIPRATRTSGAGPNANGTTSSRDGDVSTANRASSAASSRRGR